MKFLKRMWRRHKQRQADHDYEVHYDRKRGVYIRGGRMSRRAWDEFVT